MGEAVAGADTNARWLAGGHMDEDEHFGQDLWEAESSSAWTPECWHKSPEQMVEEARAMNIAAFQGASANSRKHSH